MASVRVRVAVALALIVTTGACKGDAKTSLDALQSSTTTTTANGETTSTRSGAVTTTAGGAPGRTASPGTPTTGASRNVGGPPSALATVPFPSPKVGAYLYHERVQPQSGSPTERARRFDLSAVKGRAGVIRWDESMAGSPASAGAGDHYEQVHDKEGLHLLNAYVMNRDECRWSPRSVLLPRAVIAGGEAESRSTCTVPIDGKPTTLRLETKLKFVRTHDFEVGGVFRPCIDVQRTRVLFDEANNTTITAEGLDTYAFDLRVRVRTEEHTTTVMGANKSEATRILTLTGYP